MTVVSALRTGAVGLALLTVSVAVPAQEVLPAPTPTADALATQMRVLAGDPRDVAALIAAGDLSVKLGDPAAALAFLGRAQTVAPSDPRIPAGRANALVLLERPGEALRLYDQAERAGLAMAPYLAQRGLAYDLIGQPGYAQRDYRRALALSRDDETVRRLALSLGIAGQRDEAMALLDPLLRTNNRAAWRARACILAIGGDTAGAQRIAASMMPGGAALGPFLARLQWLSPADRAFAVHFGEVTGSAARASDARLAPTVAMLPTDATPPFPPPTNIAANSVRGPTLGRREPIATAAILPAPQPKASAPPPAPAALAMRSPTIDTPMVPQRPPADALRPTPAITTGWAMTADAPAVPVAPLPKPVQREAAPSADTTAAPPAAAPPALPAPVAEAPPPVPAKRHGETLASIIATIAVPASELDVAAPAPAHPRAARPADAEPAKAAARKPEPRKAVPEKPDPAKAEPARWWAQVASGANAADLGKEWKRLAARSPAAFRGRMGWTTPLRATNRLLAGPFGSQGEAAAFVAAIAKNGSTGFAWRSEAGQTIAKLGAP